MARTRPLLPELNAAPAHPSAGHLDASAAPAAQAAQATPRGAFARHAYDAIRNAILNCTLLPGAALSEQTLSDSLGTSRAPVRDALKQLASEGLVQVLPQKGTFVSRIDPVKVRDAVFVREVIECRAAQLACAAPEADKSSLQSLLKTQAEATARSDYAAHLLADEALHQRILELAGHPHAWPALRLARTGMNRIRHLAIAAVGSHHISIHQHQHIVDAIVKNQTDHVGDLMREHIRSPLLFLDVIAKNNPEYIEN